MASRWARTDHPDHTSAERARDWRKAMSDNVAYALLVYTGLQIFMTVKAMKEGGYSMLPLIALVLLVALIIPFCRSFERRWRDLSDVEAHNPALAKAYRQDKALLWALAIGAPVALTMLIKAALTLF